MFTLWYSILTYKEYRDVIWDKLGSKKAAQPKETAIVCPLPTKKNEPAPLIEPTKPTTPVLSKVPPNLPSPPIKPTTPPVAQPSLPTTPPKVAPSSFPSPQIKPVTPPVLQKLDPPPKPPRSPSPHPIRAEAFDNVDDDEEESEESSEPEEEDSVLATPPKKPMAKTVNDFINSEKNDLL